MVLTASWRLITGNGRHRQLWPDRCSVPSRSHQLSTASWPYQGQHSQPVPSSAQPTHQPDFASTTTHHSGERSG